MKYNESEAIKYNMVISSTFNQIVNYIPIMLLKDENKNFKGLDKIINITLKGNCDNENFSQINNKVWDNNLKEVLKDIEIVDVYIEKDKKVSNIQKAIDDKLKTLDDRSIIWNITGGQRTNLLAIMNVIRFRSKDYEDKIIYLEGGNSSLKLIDAKNYLDSSEGIKEYDLLKDSQFEVGNCLNLETLLKLSNFDINKGKMESAISEDKNILYFYDELNKMYEDDNIDLIKLLFSLNGKKELSKEEYSLRDFFLNKIIFKKGKKEKELEFEKIKKCKEIKNCKKIKGIEILEELILIKGDKTQLELRKFKGKKDKNAIENAFEIWNSDLKILKKILKIVLNGENSKSLEQMIINEFYKCGKYNKNRFGYIFEKMIFRKISKFKNQDEKAKNFFIDLKYSMNVNNMLDEEDIDKNNARGKNFAEFDIALLDKNGKMIVFECKSGSMNHTVSKSRSFSVYKVNGVYGLPILTIPIRNEESINKLKSNSKIKKYMEKMKYTIDAAKRSHLDIWYMEDIEKQLEKKSKN